jgi:hypothetical protein
VTRHAIHGSRARARFDRDVAPPLASAILALR